MKTVVLLLTLAVVLVGRSVADPVNIQVYDYHFDPNAPELPMTQALDQLMQDDPGIRITPWGGLLLPGGSGRSSLMMSIAGETAPDIFTSWFHSIRSDVHQGFLYPLNEWIGDDLNHDDRIDGPETKWGRLGKSRQTLATGRDRGWQGLRNSRGHHRQYFADFSHRSGEDVRTRSRTTAANVGRLLLLVPEAHEPQ